MRDLKSEGAANWALESKESGYNANFLKPTPKRKKKTILQKIIAWFGF